MYVHKLFVYRRYFNVTLQQIYEYVYRELLKQERYSMLAGILWFISNLTLHTDSKIRHIHDIIKNVARKEKILKKITRIN